MVILVPPDSGPVEGCTRVKYGDWKDKLISRGCWTRGGKNRNKGVWREISPADHEGEGLGGDGFVVLMDAVSDAHFHLSLLHPVTRGVVQSTHDPGKQSGAEMSSASTAVRVQENIPEVQSGGAATSAPV